MSLVKQSLYFCQPYWAIGLTPRKDSHLIPYYDVPAATFITIIENATIGNIILLMSGLSPFGDWEYGFTIYETDDIGALARAPGYSIFCPYEEIKKDGLVPYMNNFFDRYGLDRPFWSTT